MKKDIPVLKVEDLAIAIVPSDGSPDEMWEVFILNLKNEPIRSVMVSSRGYGELDGAQRETTTLRYFWEEIGALGMELIEPIQPVLFDLANEFWVSFSFNNHLYDKKYVFVRGAIDPMNFTEIPFFGGRKGVMIR